MISCNYISFSVLLNLECFIYSSMYVYVKYIALMCVSMYFQWPAGQIESMEFEIK
jgi:hypothetical protein